MESKLDKGFKEITNLATEFNISTRAAIELVTLAEITRGNDIQERIANSLKVIADAHTQILECQFGKD